MLSLFPVKRLGTVWPSSHIVLYYKFLMNKIFTSLSRVQSIKRATLYQHPKLSCYKDYFYFRLLSFLSLLLFILLSLFHIPNGLNDLFNVLTISLRIFFQLHIIRFCGWSSCIGRVFFLNNFVFFI